MIVLWNENYINLLKLNIFSFMFIIRLEWNVDFIDNFRWWYKRKFVLGDKIRLNDNSFMFIV